MIASVIENPRADVYFRPEARALVASYFGAEDMRGGEPASVRHAAALSGVSLDLRSMRGLWILGALWVAGCGGAPVHEAPNADRGDATRGSGTRGSASTLRCEAPPPSRELPTTAAPATLRFTAEEMPPGPIGLGHATGTWSGTELLIFGGARPEEPPPAGARSEGDHGRWRESTAGTSWQSVAGYGYDPEQRRWRPLPGAPPPDAEPTDAVAWHCGRAFLLTRHGTGFRYDPSTGETTPTAREGAPVGCRGQRILTLGSLAMVFGCEGCRGRVYDASTDSWSEMGSRGEPIAWGNQRCDWLPTVLAGEQFVVLRRYRDVAGAIWDVRTKAWTAITEEGSPEQVNVGPVSDGRALYVAGQAGTEAGLFRYDLETRTWSRRPLPTGVCNLGQHATLEGGVMVQAGGVAPSPAVCGYDLVNGAIATGTQPARGEVGDVLTVIADGRVFGWGQRRGTDEGHGEMPRVPTHWTESFGRVVRFEVVREAP